MFYGKNGMAFQAHVVSKRIKLNLMEWVWELYIVVNWSQDVYKI
jgi:hypothetical protein